MPFVTPNSQDSPTFQAQAVVDKTDLVALANIAQNYGVVTGCTVSPGGGYTVNVAAGVISTLVTDINVTAVTALAPLAASATDRRDIVVASTAGVVSVISGVPTTETAIPWTNTSIYNPPVKPTLPTGSVLLAEIYIPGGGGTIVTGWITDKTITSYQSQVPNSSRLIDWGHSWVVPPAYAYAISGLAALTPTILGSSNTQVNDGNQWSSALRDALGVGSTGYWKSYYVPSVVAATATANQVLDVVPGDCTIDAVYYLPNGSLTGANTNTRGIGLLTGGHAGGLGFAYSNFTSGINLTIGQPFELYSMNDVIGINGGVRSPYLQGLRGLDGSPTPAMNEIYWQTIKVGTGGATADPGGQVIIRYGTRYRNYGVGGSTLLAGNVGSIANSLGGAPSGSWLTCLSWGAFSRPNAVEVNVTATAAVSATSISCSPLDYPLQSGAVVTFAGAVTATLTAAANASATSITVSALAAQVTIGLQGHAANPNGVSGGSYESLSPTGLHVWTHGVNDADAATQDVNAWTETVRTCIAKVVSPAWLYPYTANYQYVNGGGTWAVLAPPATGFLPFTFSPYQIGGVSGALLPTLERWGGTVSGTPSSTISVGPAFEGGTVDLIVLGLAGSSVGVSGTITVDGATPPQGSVTLNTSSLSTSGLNNRTPTGTITAAGTAVTGTGTNFTSADIGKALIPASGTFVPGTIISGVTDATHVTVSDSMTVTGVACKVNGWFPMVKRITGLAAGAHTIKLTITASDSAANSAIVIYGLGLESQNPTTPVLWCNIARTPSQTSGQKTNTVALNAATLSVVNGTATPLTGNTSEPAFGTNVQYVDIDTLFGGASPNAAYFLFDGLHPNSRGHRLMARTLFSVIRNNFSPDQLMAR